MSSARQTFALVDDETITIDLLTPHRVARVACVYPTAETFTLTVSHKSAGNSNTALEMDETAASATTLIWTPDNLWVRKNDELIFTNSNPVEAEITIEYVKDEEV